MRPPPVLPPNRGTEVLPRLRFGADQRFDVRRAEPRMWKALQGCKQPEREDRPRARQPGLLTTRSPAWRKPRTPVTARVRNRIARGLPTSQGAEPLPQHAWLSQRALRHRPGCGTVTATRVACPPARVRSRYRNTRGLPSGHSAPGQGAEPLPQRAWPDRQPGCGAVTATLVATPAVTPP